MLLAILIVPVLVIRGRFAERTRARLEFWKVVDEYEGALTRRYLQLVRRNAYGVEDRRQWERELQEFYSTRMGPELRLRRVKADLARSIMELEATKLDRRVEEAAKNLTLGMAFDPKMSPREFENFCAAIMQRGGWTTDVTQFSGDQGVDIFARRGDDSIVIQCKLYSGPVGNKAVQEALTGKVHMGARRAAVVCSTSYTPQAQHLAATTGTELLHYNQLADL